MSVLDNLYSNAVHYGAESGNICLRSSLHGARVYIDVINTGTPIPQEERAMIFEPFFQGSHQRKGAVKGQRSGIKHCQGLYSPYARGTVSGRRERARRLFPH
ncbi:sensor-like histidine kinase YfhK [Escherichia coli]|uniref:histidine kinase n=1 Tax=Escherichia coli TaxID=562 RepID=A0A376NUS9_ECOLX|nr:sensor-like histidine kinase YfhK [Escherichia coli]